MPTGKSNLLPPLLSLSSTPETVRLNVVPAYKNRVSIVDFIAAMDHQPSGGSYHLIIPGFHTELNLLFTSIGAAFILEAFWGHEFM